MSNSIEFMAALGWGLAAICSLRCAITHGDMLNLIFGLYAILCLAYVVGGIR